MKVETTYCDICKNAEKVSNKKIQTIFITEQTEGRSVSPHLSDECMDICKVCFSRRVAGESVWGHGAQGHNTYYFKEVKNEA